MEWHPSHFWHSRFFTDFMFIKNGDCPQLAYLDFVPADDSVIPYEWQASQATPGIAPLSKYSGLWPSSLQVRQVLYFVTDCISVCWGKKKKKRSLKHFHFHALNREYPNKVPNVLCVFSNACTETVLQMWEQDASTEQLHISSPSVESATKNVVIKIESIIELRPNKKAMKYNLISS